jgi:hypothetical protein
LGFLFCEAQSARKRDRIRFVVDHLGHVAPRGRRKVDPRGSDLEQGRFTIRVFSRIVTNWLEIGLEAVASAIDSAQLTLSQNLDSVLGSRAQGSDVQLRDATLSL